MAENKHEKNNTEHNFQALPWSDFVREQSPGAFARNWLNYCCEYLPDLHSAVVLMHRPETSRLVPAAHWPDSTAVDLGLNQVVDTVLAQGKPVVIPSFEQGGATYSQLCYPVFVADQCVAVVALKIACRPTRELEVAMRTLRWGCAWLALFHQRSLAPEGSGGRDQYLANVLDLLACALEQGSFRGAAMALVNELSRIMSCSRVSIGLYDKGFNTVVASSDTSHTAEKSGLWRIIAQAMDEAIDQQVVLVHPLTDNNALVLNERQQALSSVEENLSHSVCSLPLANDGQFIGAICLERSIEKPFSEAELEFCELLSVLAGPVFENQRLAERGPLKTTVDYCRAQLQRLFGPRYYGRKFAAVALAVVLLFFSIWDGSYRVRAKASLESTVRRAVVAPVDGFVDTARARAGDKIAAGQVLYTLDDRDLVLEKLKWQSEKIQLGRQMRDAVATRDGAKMRILEAQLEQADAQLSLVVEKLSRLKGLSSFDGYVISGDLMQSLGAPVSRGDVLFEIAPLDAYRVLVRVDERDISDIAPGQRGHVTLHSASEQALPFVVERITPLAQSDGGANTFEVEARLETLPDYLRPGMEGIAKVEVGQRKLIWIWTHSFTQWLRLQLWRWF